METVEDLKEIGKKLGVDLFNMCNYSDAPSVVSPKLIFPNKGDVTRFSEQEARTLYCNILNCSWYHYSIETPTEETYQLTGISGSRASTDLTLWLANQMPMNRVANIEFKAHSSDRDSINKDILKLSKELPVGGWIHLLKNMDSKTLEVLFRKFEESFLKNGYAVQNGYDFTSKDISIVFCFYVIEKKAGFIKHFNWAKGGNLKTYVQQFFDIDYAIINQKVELVDANDWDFIEG